MKFVALVAILGAVSAYKVVPADGIMLFVADYDDSIAREERKAERLSHKGKSLNQFDGLYHNKNGVFDSKGRKINDQAISM